MDMAIFDGCRRPINSLPHGLVLICGAGFSGINHQIYHGVWPTIEKIKHTKITFISMSAKKLG
jgi:hypothetical protein